MSGLFNEIPNWYKDFAFQVSWQFLNFYVKSILENFERQILANCLEIGYITSSDQVEF